MARIVFLVLFCIQLILGLSTVHIVQHWDEAKLVDSVIQQYSNGRFLPSWYNYPSVIFNLTYFDYFIWNLGIKNIIPDFNIFNRGVFYTISLLPSIVLFQVFYKRKAEWIGVATAILYFASWEFHYHSRWVAPDVIAAVFGITSICFLLNKTRNSLVLSAIMAGLAFSTKYTAGIFLLPVMIQTLYDNRLRSLKNVLIIAGTFVLTFAITSPGIFIHWSKAMADIRFEQQHYSTGHNEYTVDNFWQHFKRNCYYLILVLPTKNKILSIVLIIIGCVGFSAMLRNKKYSLVVITATVLLFIIYLSTQKVMFVRNLMICWPLLCLLIGYGIYSINRFSPGNRRNIFAFIIVATFGLGFNLKTDMGILRSDENTPVVQFKNYLAKHPDKKIWLSPVVKSKTDTTKFNNFQPIPDKGDIDFYALYLWEIPQWRLPANQPGWIYKNFGTGEVNIEYYPTYPGNQRIILVKDPSILTGAGMVL
jgi:hypothetical protein